MIGKTEFTKVGNLDAFRVSAQSDFEARLKSNPDYQFLLDKIAEFEKRKTQTTVSLNEEKTRAERELEDTKELNYINARRAAKGLSPLKSKSEMDKKEEDIDLILDESINLLIQFLNTAK
jgi:carboxyl-terminal processing protease